MRDIEFRGKADNKWLYGYLIEMKQLDDETDKVAIIEKNSSFDIASGKLKQDMWNVNPVTVGQYIGLQDNNNKRIYEGDVLQDNADPDEIFLVDFCDGEFVLINDVNVYLDIENVHFLSVIGNIHDDKELYKFFKSEDK